MTDHVDRGGVDPENQRSRDARLDRETDFEWYRFLAGPPDLEEVNFWRPRGGAHDITNGLLLRSDLHTPFDRGYVTVTPDLRLQVSRRIREEYENGREYYSLSGRELRVPRRESARPDPVLLDWHNRHRFLG